MKDNNKKLNKIYFLRAFHGIVLSRQELNNPYRLEKQG